MLETRLNQSLIEQFQENGAILLKNAFIDWVETLQDGLARNLREPSATARYHKGVGDRHFFNDYCNWARIPEYRAFIYSSPAAPIVAQLTGSMRIRLFHEHVVLKEAGNTVDTPWHQDQPYYCVNGTQTCSLWVSLDHVRRDIAVEFVKGSHKWGKMFRPMYFSGKPVNETYQWDVLPDINLHRENYEILGWETKPGDAIAFNFRTIHGAPANSTGNRRAAISFRWLGDDVTFSDRGGHTSPSFPGITLKEGDIMDAPEFPLVWEQTG